MSGPETQTHAEGHAPRRPQREGDSNAIRLGAREWLVTALIVAPMLLGFSRLVERPGDVPADPDRRIPYKLGFDYWLWARYARQAVAEHKTIVLGDSVIWGHYVTQDHALPAAMNRQAGAARFANLGVDGIHPAAMAGLIEYYGGDIRDGPVVLHCNLLWMSSARHDLRGRKRTRINHPTLIPQFHPWIASYGAEVAQRMAVSARRVLPWERAAQHLRIAYFDGNDIPTWTIRHSYDDPLAAMGEVLPSGRPAEATAEEAVPWTQRGIEPYEPAWVDLETSLQWGQFRRAVDLLIGRGNRIFVLVGPFNEHMLTPAAREAYRQRVEAVRAWLAAKGIPCYAPDALPSPMYADASHPLPAGYELLAARLYDSPEFARFEGREPRPAEGGRP